MLEDRADALWPRDLIERARVRVAPEMRRVVVAVDPPAASGTRSDACGIIVAGVGADDRAYVLADWTRERASPLDWAGVAVAAYRRFEADRIVVEVNQGGELVETVIRQIDRTVPVPFRARHARQVAEGRAGRSTLRAGPRRPCRRAA